MIRSFDSTMRPIGCSFVLGAAVLMSGFFSGTRCAQAAVCGDTAAHVATDPKGDKKKVEKKDKAKDSQDASKKNKEKDSQRESTQDSQKKDKNNTKKPGKKAQRKDEKPASGKAAPKNTRKGPGKPTKKAEKKAEKPDPKKADPNKRKRRTPRKRGTGARGEKSVSKRRRTAVEPSPKEGEPEPPKAEIPSELRKKVDALLDAREKAGDKVGTPSGERRRRRPSRGRKSRVDASKKERSTPGTGSGKAPGREDDRSPTTTLDIPPTPPAENKVRAEDRTYSLGLVDVTYEQLIDAIARETGLAIQGVIPKAGKVSFVTDEDLSFEELLARVRMLLFQYKPHEPYWLLRTATHLEVLRVNDYIRIMPPNRMFRSVEEFRAANLPDHELVLVLYTPSSGSVADLQVVRDFMPDYVRVTPLEGKNTVTIFALVSDINKYLDMVGFFEVSTADPRTIAKIPVRYITPTEAVEKLRELMDLDGGGSVRRPKPKSKRGREPSPLIGVQAPDVTVVPVDAHGIILVRAMEDKIAEIKLLLPYLDLPVETEYQPVIIPVKHADPAELIQTIEEILVASKPPDTLTKSVALRKRKRSGRPPKSGAQSATAGKVTMLTHPSASAIIVLADDESLATVRRLVELFDVEEGVRNETITVHHRDANDLVGILEELLGGSTAAKGRKKGAVGQRYKLVASPSGEAFWFTGSREDLETVREMLAILDTPGAEVTLHVKRLVHQLPSFVAGILRQYDSGSPTSAARAVRGVRRGRKTPKKQAPSKFTPDDEQGRLFVLCTDSEWEQYLPLIDQLEAEVSTDEFVFIPVQHMDPGDAITKLSTLLANSVGAEEISYETVSGGFLVMGANAPNLEMIQSLIKELDQAVETEERIFEIKHGDPSEIASAVETLIGAEGGTGARPAPRKKLGRKIPKSLPSATPPSLTIVEMGQRLIVRTSPDKMKRVAELIAEFDVPERATELRVYDDFPPGTDIEWIADTLSSTLVGPRSARKPGVQRGKTKTTQEPQFIAQPAAQKLLVIAESAAFEEIEKLLDVFKHPVQRDPVVVYFIDVKFADPEELVEAAEPLLDLKVEQLMAAGVLNASVEVPLAGPRSGVKPGTTRRHANKRQGTQRPYHLAPVPGHSRVVIAGPQRIIDEARSLIASLDQPGDQPNRIEVAYVALAHADALQVVEAVAPLLQLKVHEHIEAGELSEPKGATSAPRVQGKGRISAARAATELYHLEPDVRSQRIAIAAPPLIIEDAKKLIAEFDQEGSAEKPIFRTVALRNSEPADMVKAIGELMGGPNQPRRNRVRKPSAGPAPASAATTTFRIVEAPSGGAVVLQGAAKDVNQAEEWIEELEKVSVSDRLIKVYQIQYADLRRLVDLIVADVGAPPKVANKAAQNIRRKAMQMRSNEPKEEEDEFATTITRTGTDLYIQADLIENMMIVSASPSKMSRIDEIVATMDKNDDSINMRTVSVPKHMIELKYADPFDAAEALESVLDVYWQPSDSLPKVDYYDTFGNVLVVKYPDESRFPEIDELVAKYVDKPDRRQAERVKRALLTLPGMSAVDTARLLQLNHPELDIDLVDISTADDKTWNMAEVLPPTKAKGRPCVLPLSFQRAASMLLAATTSQVETEEPAEDPEEADEDPPAEDAPEDAAADEKETPSDAIDVALQEVGKSLLDEQGSAGDQGKTVQPDAKATESGNRPKPPGAEKIKLYYNDEGQLLVEGERGVVKEIPDMLDELKEELKDLPRPPDIRIYRLRFIDVYSAQTIINEMFNATQSQRAQVRAQQQRAAAARQRQQQLRKQQQQKGQQAGQPGQPGQARPGPRSQQGRASLAQLPTPTVRVYPNPRDRTLILRADTNQYPALLKLLATIDQPKPIDSKHRIFQLKKLRAADVEALLTDWLGLNQPAQRRAKPAGPGRTRQTRRSTQKAIAPGGQLPKTILQKAVIGDLELEVDPKDIKLSSNDENNTILAMAPEAALDYIEKVIADLESYDLPERKWKNYELIHADVEEAVAYLSDRYGASRPGTARNKARRNSAKSKSPAATLAAGFSAPTFISFPRLNMVSAQANDEQFKEIDELITKLDTPREEDEFHSVTLKAADAKVVADTLTAMFGKGGTPSRKIGRKGRSTPSVGPGPTFIGEEGGKLVFYSAPQHQQQRILEVIEELEEQSKIKTKVRVIQLAFGKPSQIAEAIEGAYGAGGSRGRSKRGKSSATAVRQFTVTPSDATKRLFVLADDDLFAEIESLAKSLDTPAKMDAEFKVFPLQYASAKESHETMTKLVTDYLKRLPRDTPMEPFSVEVNEEANALVVLGSPMIFGFVEEALSSIDTPANVFVPPAVLMVPLKNADATEVAQAITKLWASRDSKSGAEPPKAEANRAMNLLIVRGTQKQIDEIKKDILDPLEKQEQQALVTETITLAHARAEDVADLITRIFEDQKKAAQGAQSGRPKNALESTVAVTADAQTNQLIVQASAANLKMIKERIALIDTKEIAEASAISTKVYSLRSADPTTVANIIKEWGQSRGQKKGGKQATSPGDMVMAVAEPWTQTVVVTAAEPNHKLIQKMIDDLDKEDQTDQMNTHVINLNNAEAEAVSRTLNDILVRTAPKQSGRTPSISAVQGSKAVMVRCNNEDFETIQGLIETLDREDVVVGEAIRAVTLLYTDATEVQTALTEYLAKPGGTGRTPELVGDTRISVLTQSNAIILSGDKERVERLESLARDLDKAGEKGSVPQIIPLKHIEVAQVLPTLQEAFSESARGGGRSGTRQPIIVGNEAAGGLVVRADPTDMAAIEATVALLDTPEAAAAEMFKLVSVAQGINVEDLADTLETSINASAESQAPRGGRDARIPRITITPDKRTSTLLLTGSAQLFGVAEKMVRAYEEKGPSKGMGIRIIRLSDVAGSDVERLIAQLKGESSGNQRRSVRRGGSRGRRTNRSSARSSGTRRRSGNRRSSGTNPRRTPGSRRRR